MHYKLYELKVAAPPEDVWQFFSSARALEELTPPGVRLRLANPEAKVEEGALHVIKMWALGFLPVTWKARISQVTPPYGFTDQAEQSPFKFMRHRHDLIPDGDGTLIRDMIAYIVPPGGKLGKAINRLVVSKHFDRIFEHRHEKLRELFG